MPIVNPAHNACLIDDRLGWHAPEFKDLDLLPIGFQHLMLGVSNPDEGQLVFAEVVFKSVLVVRSNDNHLGAAIDKYLVVLAQLRHMPAAEGSLEAAVEYEQYSFCTLERRELESISLVI